MADPVQETGNTPGARRQVSLTIDAGPRIWRRGSWSKYSASLVATAMSVITFVESRLCTWAFLALLCLAVLVRVRGLDRALWTAETWVANSVISPSFVGMFYYPAWLQTTPPVMLLFVRGAVRLLGASNWSFRFIPFAFGVLAVALHALLSRRIFGRWLALFSTTLVALSPSAVVFSKELKQYSADLASAAMILLVLWIYIARPDRRSFAQLLIAFAVSIGLSDPAVMFLPLAMAVLLTAQPDFSHSSEPLLSGGVTRMIRCVCFTIPIVWLEVLHYIIFVRPNSAPQLFEYWRDGFPKLANFGVLTRFYAQNFAGIPLYFFLGLHSKDVLKAVLRAVPGPLLLLLVSASGVGLLMLALRICRRRQNRYLVAFACAPVATLALANLVHVYPVDARRLMLFLLPGVAIGLTLFLEEFCTAMRLDRLEPDTRQRLLNLIGIVAVCVLPVAIARSGAFDPWEQEDVQVALRDLRYRIAEGDLVYVHASLVESVKLYLGMMNWQNAPVIYGDSGWGCCPRRDERQLRYDHGASLTEELATLKARAPGRILWLLFTGRGGQWVEINRNDPEIFTAALCPSTCQQGGGLVFPDVVVYRLRCHPQ